MTDTVLSTATREAVIGFDRPFVVSGERINPTGRKLLAEEMQRVREEIGAERYDSGRFDEAIALFDELSTSESFTEFLTLPAYDKILTLSAE